jgi:hypothetical protein
MNRRKFPPFLLLRLAPIFLGTVLLPSLAHADVMIGGACSGTVAAGPQAANGNNALCNTATWQYPAYQFGSTALSCTTTQAGMIQWNGTSILGCTTTWTSLAASTTAVTLGGSVTVNNPSISNDATSGFYTSGAGAVDVAISGINVAAWASTGVTIAGSATANSFIPNSATVPTNGMYLSAANTLDFSTASAHHLQITATGGLNIVTATAGLQLGGTTIFTYPDAGADTTSLAIGANALSSQAVTSGQNVAIGYQAGEYISTGTLNTAVGYSAMLGITGSQLTGTENTAIGANALLKLQGGGSNISFEDTAVGYNAASAVTTGSWETVLGANVASTTQATGTSNVLIGTDSTTDTYSATSSDVVGIGTGVVPGTYDVGVGYQALHSTAADSLGNAAIGYQAGEYISTGANNTALGYQALQGVSGNKLAANYNSAVGYQAMQTIQGSAATQNVAFGGLAMQLITTGTNDTAVGYAAGQNMGSGSNDAAIGVQAMQNFQNDAGWNVAIGYKALQGTTTPFSSGGQNTAVGALALESVSGSTGLLTAVGYEALQDDTSGTGNSAFGYQSMAVLTTGSYNTAVGYQALQNIAGGTGSTTAVGYQALQALTTGAGNSALGYWALKAATISSNNTAVGYEALETTSTGAGSNTAVGYQALSAVTSGNDNTAIGYQAGNSITTGIENTAIGYGANTAAASINSTAIGYMASTTTSNVIQLGNSSVTKIYAYTTSITNSSDRRLKKDITASDLGLEFIEKLKPVSYRFNNGDETLRYGFIAQDIEQALPPDMEEMIENNTPSQLALVNRDYDEKRTYHVAYTELLSPIVKSIQQQEEEFTALKDAADDLAAANEKQQAELDELRQKIMALEEEQ